MYKLELIERITDLKAWWLLYFGWWTFYVIPRLHHFPSPNLCGKKRTVIYACRNGNPTRKINTDTKDKIVRPNYRGYLPLKTWLDHNYFFWFFHHALGVKSHTKSHFNISTEHAFIRSHWNKILLSMSQAAILSTSFYWAKQPPQMKTNYCRLIPMKHYK